MLCSSRRSPASRSTSLHRNRVISQRRHPRQGDQVDRIDEYVSADIASESPHSLAQSDPIRPWSRTCPATCPFERLDILRRVGIHQPFANAVRVDSAQTAKPAPRPPCRPLTMARARKPTLFVAARRALGDVQRQTSPPRFQLRALASIWPRRGLMCRLMFNSSEYQLERLLSGL